MDPYDPPLDKARHLRYWQRCLRTLLPHHYTSMDSTRLSLAFFIIASVDLLTPSPSPSPPDDSSATTKPPTPLLTPADRVRLRRWVLSCQHPAGGFCGSPTHVLPRHLQRGDVENAHLGGTYFALLLLALLSDDDSADSAFAGVDRAATLRWLRRLQRPEDGSFGEIVYDPPVFPVAADETNKSTDTITRPQPMIAGGRDMRYSYLAAAVRWMLRDDSDEEDIDVPALVAHIRRGQTYDGGFAESRAHESHAGYAYCAVAALALLDRPSEGGGGGSGKALDEGVADTPALAKWLSSRQFVYVQNANGDDDDDDDDDDPETANFRLADLSLAANDDHDAPAAQHIGFNGRCNKIADTCYTWWTLGALAVLGLPPPHHPDPDPASLRARRAFLLDKTQHLIGGFGKNVGSPPDVGHACLGLAALATMRDPSLRALDPALCVSVDAVRRVERARRGLLGRQRGESGGDAEAGVAADLGGRLVNIALKMRGDGRPEWLDAVA